MNMISKILFYAAVVFTAFIYLIILMCLMVFFVHGLINMKTLPFIIEKVKPNDIKTLSTRLMESPYYDFNNFRMNVSGDVITITTLK